MKTFSKNEAESFRNLNDHSIFIDKPNWVVEWGTLIIALTIVVLLFFLYFIQYPDILKVPAVLSTENNPVEIRVNKNTYLRKILVKEGDYVNKGQVLCYLESTADVEEVFRLNKVLGSIEHRVLSIKDYKSISQNKYLNLGELQSDFQVFSNNLNLYNSFVNRKYYSNMLQVLQKEIDNLIVLKGKIIEQQIILKQDYDLSLRELSIQNKLLKDKVISQMDIYQWESKIINKQIPVKQNEQQLIATEATLSLKRKELLELNKRADEVQSSLLQSIVTLKVAVKNWFKDYLLLAPVSGKINFFNVIQNNQPVSGGKEVFYISPINDSYYAQVKISQASFGKVKVSQRVILKFNSYPYYEFGSIEGTIVKIYEVPAKDSTFLARVSINKEGLTDYHHKILYKNGMNATAEIVTRDVRLFERVFFNSKRTFSR